MGLIGFIVLSILFFWWSSKVNIQVSKKTAKWHLEEAIKLNPTIAYLFRQPEKMDRSKNTETWDLDSLSKEELMAIIRKMAQE